MSKRVLVIAPNFYPKAGGVETYVRETGKRIAKKGYEITVLSPRYGDEPKEENVDGLKVKRSRRFFSLSNMNFFPGVFFRIRKEEFDLMHLHHPDPVGNISGWFWAKRKNKPYVVTYHADISRKDLLRKIAAPIYENLFLKRILREAEFVTTTTPIYPKISCVLSKMKLETVTVPCGYDSSRFIPKNPQTLKKKLGLEKKKVILYLGRLNYYKGLPYLIEAYRQIRQKMPDTALVIAGSGPEEKKLKELSRGLGIIFTGRVPDKEMAEYYSLAEVYVLPSVYEAEGFGISLLEAMACGVPVVTTNLSGMPYVVNFGKAGLLCEPRDSKELAQKILILMENKGERATVLKNAKGWVSNFTWDRVSKELEKVYLKSIRG
jgi:glycosyltransferase involved in cell wall biosynthesis